MFIYNFKILGYWNSYAQIIQRRNIYLEVHSTPKINMITKIYKYFNEKYILIEIYNLNNKKTLKSLN